MSLWSIYFHLQCESMPRSINLIGNLCNRQPMGVPDRLFEVIFAQLLKAQDAERTKERQILGWHAGVVGCCESCMHLSQMRALGREQLRQVKHAHVHHADPHTDLRVTVGQSRRAGIYDNMMPSTGLAYKSVEKVLIGSLASTCSILRCAIVVWACIALTRGLCT